LSRLIPAYLAKNIRRERKGKKERKKRKKKKKNEKKKRSNFELINNINNIQKLIIEYYFVKKHVKNIVLHSMLIINYLLILRIF